MAEKSSKNAESHHSRYRHTRPVVTPNLQNVQSRRQDEESINLNLIVPANLAYVLRPSLFQRPPVTWQSYYNNFIYRPTLQPYLSQTYFHRQDRGNSQGRSAQVSPQHGRKTSIKDFRFWEKISSAHEGFTFSVMCYNVLAQDLLEQHPHLYATHKKQFLTWQVRWNNLLAEIEQLHPDILCLQEVQNSHLDQYFSHLAPMGYLRLYKQRTGIRTDGCAIFYKHRLVNLIEHTTVEFNQPNVSILDRDNVAIIAKFAPEKHPDKEFVIATTHLLYNPKRQDVRLAQTQLLFTEVDRIAFKKGQYLPVILTGDLNSTPESAVIKFITKGKLKYENLSSRLLQKSGGPKIGKVFLPSKLRITDQCQHADLIRKRKNDKVLNRAEELQLIEIKHSERGNSERSKAKKIGNDNLFSSGTLSHQFLLESVHSLNVNGDSEATTLQDEWISVDYIFYSKTNGANLVLLERYKLPTKSQLRDKIIPNQELGSDHLSLMAKFKLLI